MYIKTIGILFRSTVLHKCLGYPAGKAYLD